MFHASVDPVTRVVPNSLFCIECLRQLAIGMPTGSHSTAGPTAVALDAVSNFRQQATQDRDLPHTGEPA
jgi:hypothetical protein